MPLLLLASARRIRLREDAAGRRGRAVQVMSASSGETALRLFEAEHPSLVIIRRQSPRRVAGAELSKSIRLAANGNADLRS
jgi:DNA-binding response OmpR family regulator